MHPVTSNVTNLLSNALLSSACCCSVRFGGRVGLGTPAASYGQVQEMEAYLNTAISGSHGQGANSPSTSADQASIWISKSTTFRFARSHSLHGL